MAEMSSVLNSDSKPISSSNILNILLSETEDWVYSSKRVKFNL